MPLEHPSTTACPCRAGADRVGRIEVVAGVAAEFRAKDLVRPIPGRERRRRHRPALLTALACAVLGAGCPASAIAAVGLVPPDVRAELAAVPSAPPGVPAAVQ